MLQPRKTKYRFQFRGRMKGNSIKGASLSFGEFGLKALERTWLTAAQIEAARKAITHYTKRKARVWIRVFPDKPITGKAGGGSMGGGKGDIKDWVVVVKPGRILFEVGGVPEEIARGSLKRAQFKLPIATKIISED